MRTLDSVMAELRARHDLSGGIYLKIDTQGYDLEVIRGATESLPHIAAVQTELASQRLYQGMPSYIEVLNALDARGFHLSGVFPVSQDTLLRIIECDAVMLNGARIDVRDVHLMHTGDV